ncbi:MAG: hypothetical protein M5U34_16650 [Chloroflexi bacterium]|nr:hypothetical protein [Chloroflexota bacterium]
MPQFKFLGWPEPAAAKNPFLEKSEPSLRIQNFKFSGGQALLPQPVLPEHDGWLEMYWRAWQIAWSNLHRGTAANGFVSPYARTVGEPILSAWDSCFAALYGVYARRGFDFIVALDNFLHINCPMALLGGNTAQKMVKPFIILTV